MDEINRQHHNSKKRREKNGYPTNSRLTLTLQRHTSLLSLLVVALAHQLVVLHQVKLVAGVELSLADDAGEAVQMVHVVLGAANHLSRRDALLAARALGAVPPGEGRGENSVVKKASFDLHYSEKRKDLPRREY